MKSYKVRPNSDEFLKDLKDFVKTQEEPTISTGPYAQYKVMQEAHKYVTVVLDGQGADEMMAGYLPYYFVYLNQLWKMGKYLSFFKRSVIIMGCSYEICKEKIFVETQNFASLLNNEFANQYAGGIISDRKFQP